MKPDLSKDGLKRFFLYHTEKIILGGSILLMGLFFWLGFNAQPFKDKSPSELISLAEQAEQYISKPDSWDQVREVVARQGQTDLVKRIQVGNEAIDVANYPFGFWSIRAKTLSTRKDPQLNPPQDLVASHVVEPLLFTPSNLDRGAVAMDPLSKIQLVSEASMASDTRGSQAGSGDEIDPGRGRGAGRGDLENPPPSRPEKSEESEFGDRILAIHQKTFPGIRPTKWGLSNSMEQVLLDDVVVVTGLVNIKQLKSNFAESFSEAVGYLPSRDKPIFKFLEVQRSEITDGEPQWVDISTQISRLQMATPNALTTMPESEFPSAPEVVDPNCFDPIVTQPIPAFTRFDYRKIANHTSLPFRQAEKLASETKAKTVTGILGSEEDPDDQDDDLSEEKNPVRLGSDTTKYEEALSSRKLINDYKLVRFFDVSKKEPGKVYQYRVRYWVADPNNPPSSSELAGGGNAQIGAGRDRGDIGRGRGGPDPGRGNPGRGTGRGIPGRGNPGRGAGREPGGLGDMLGGAGGVGLGDNAGGRSGAVGGNRSGGSEESGGEDAGYQFVEITPQMTDPAVRSRLASAKEEPDKKDKKPAYFVQESYYDELVPVPKGKDELRYCRPSPWSEPVKVAITPQPRGEVIAGQIETPRSIRISSFELLDGEPIIELVVAPWDRTFRAMLPGRKKTYRGEALDFVANSHVLNPISWLVHKFDNAPVFSQAVLVDLMGGNELALPKDDFMRYYTAAEMLIMEPDGSLKVSNDLGDRTKYKQALLLPDDPNEFGAPRERKVEEDERRGPVPGGGRGR